jgi:hypothetical protein
MTKITYITGEALRYVGKPRSVCNVFLFSSTIQYSKYIFQCSLSTFEYIGPSTVQVFVFLHNKMYFLDELHMHILLEHL